MALRSSPLVSLPAGRSIEPSPDPSSLTSAPAPRSASLASAPTPRNASLARRRDPLALAPDAYQVLSDDRRRAEYDLRLRLRSSSYAHASSSSWASSSSSASYGYGYGYGPGPGGGSWCRPPPGGGAASAGFDWGFLLKVVTRRGFSFDDADEDPPTAARGDKRKRDDGPADAAVDGRPPKARNLAARDREREGRAVVGEESAGGCGREVEMIGGEGNGGISVRIDPDLLDCSICFEPLRSPLYQCQNGHVACFSCWSRINNKCHICSHDANLTRNIALEKIVESIKSSCSYAKWGCGMVVSYVQRNTHEEACLFAPSMCPIPGCGYRGFTGCWSGHFVNNHSADGLRFIYGQSFEVNLEVSVPFLVLLGEDDHLFLLLNKNMMPYGHAFSVVCLRTGNLNWKFSYEFKAASRGNPENCLQLKASVTNTKEWRGLHPAQAFLLVPYDFCSSTNLTLNVSIERCAAAV